MAAKPNALSVVLIVPNAARRRSLATALAGSQFTIARELDKYPMPDDLPELARLSCDAVIVDLDGDVEHTLSVIESLCRLHVSTTVVAYTSSNDPIMMRRAMQAGAREFLVDPLLPDAVAEMFARASARRLNPQKPAGKTLVFLPSKGGVGVTTITLNFALALAKESGGKVVLVDMDFQLGEIALGLGMVPTFSVVDALLNPDRLDKEFLSTILLRHSSGVAVLAAPEKFGFFHAPSEGAAELFRILREEFDYVVVDAGTCHSHIQQSLFELADTLYLVAEMNFPSLRNGHRLVAYLSSRDENQGLEVVLNRYNSHGADIDENSATKALGRPLQWRIPNGYAVARAAQNSGVPLPANSPVARALGQMAKAACNKPLTPAKPAGKGFSFFRSRAEQKPAAI